MPNIMKFLEEFKKEQPIRYFLWNASLKIAIYFDEIGWKIRQCLEKKKGK